MSSKNLYFYRSISDDSFEIRNQITSDDAGIHRFFRTSGPRMQKRFTELVDCKNIPKVLIHGNPHIANYCKTSRGAAMVDFDRSRIGPYSYDIVRFLVSISFSGRQVDDDFLHPVVVDHFRRGYTYGLLNKKYEHEEMLDLREREPRKWQMSAENYLESGKKWAKKLFENTVEITSKRKKMLDNYMKSLDNNSGLDSYVLTTCAEVPGSMGKIHYLYLLRDPSEKLDPIIIDIKEVYEEENDKWFSNPFNHHGIRMNKAGEVYAPGWEQLPGHSSYKGEQFWCRQIPIQQVKLDFPIDTIDQCDLCFSVGAQLGRGHSRASKEVSAKEIFKDFKEMFDDYLKVAQDIHKEIKSAHEVYCAETTLKKYGIK